MPNSFADLIPDREDEKKEKRANPFADLIPPASQKADASRSSFGTQALDVGRAALSGVRGGIEGLIGLPGDIDKALTYGVKWAAQKSGIAPQDEEYLAGTGKYAPPIDLGTSGVRSITDAVIGEGYRPETTAGKYARTIGEFVPGSMIGPGKMAQKAFSYGVMPGAVSEAAGQATEGTAAEPWARVAGAILGSGGVLSKAAQYPMNKVKKLVEPVVGSASPSTVANQRIAAAMERDARIGGPEGYAPLSPGEFAAAEARGQPVMNLERGGELTRGLGRNAANASPEARATLRNATEPRFPSQSNRLSEFLRKLGGDKDAYTAREELLKESRKVRAPMYEKAYKAGENGIDSRALEELQTSPAISGGRPRQEGLGGAMQDAEIRIRNRHAAEAAENAAQGKQTPPVDFRIHAGKGYTLEFWDAVKQSLDDDITRYLSRGDNGRARELTNVRDRLVDALDGAVPSYAEARGTASTFFGAGSALEAGEKYATAAARYKNTEAKAAFEQLTSREKELFREGYVSRMVGNATEAVDRQNLATRLLNSPSARERAELVLGPQGVKELSAQLHVENLMELGRKEISGNSQTARWLMEAGMAGAAGGYGYFTGDPNALLFLGALGGRRLLNSVSERKVAMEIAQKLASNDPNAIREAAKQIAKSQSMMSSLEETGRFLTRSVVQGSLAGQRVNRERKRDSLAGKLRSLSRQ